MIKAKVIIGAIRASEVEEILETIEVEVVIIEVREETLRIEMGHMTEEEIKI